MTSFVWDLQRFAVSAKTGIKAASTLSGGTQAFTADDDSWKAVGASAGGLPTAAGYYVASAAGSNVIIANGYELSTDNATVGVQAAAGTASVNTAGSGAVSIDGAAFTFGDGLGLLGYSNGAIVTTAGTVAFTGGEAAKVSLGSGSAYTIGVGGTAASNLVSASSFVGSLTTIDAGVTGYAFTGSGSTAFTLDLSAATATRFSVTGSSSGDSINAGSSTVGDTIIGEGGDDYITISGGTSYVNGGNGADFITFDSNNSVNTDAVTILGGAGNDTIDLSKAKGSGHSIDGGAGKDSIVSGTGAFTNSTIWGGSDDNIIYAGTGAGNSYIGGSGKDTLVASATKSTLTGGEGADVFSLTNGTNALAYISDYNLGAGDVVSLKGSTASEVHAALATAGTAKASFTSDGVVSLSAGSSVATLTGSDNYFAVNFKDSDTTQLVAWGGTSAATINAGSMTKAAIILGNTNDTVGDSIVGSSQRDTIFAGANDTVYGGAGNDKIVVDGAGAYIGSSSSGGIDTVTNFVSGFDKETADVIHLMDGNADSLTFTTGATAVTLANGDNNSKMIFTGLNQNTDGGFDLLIDSAKVVVAGSGSTISASSAAYADAYYGTKSTGLSFAAVDSGDVNVHLTDTTKYRNITTLQGGQVNTTLIGSSANETLIATGGNTTLWGGAGKNYLKGAADAVDHFALMTGSGTDTVEGFAAYTADTADVADVVNTFGTGISSAASVSGGIKLETSEGASMLLKGIGGDQIVTYIDQYGTTNRAKIGAAGKKNTFTYEDGTTLYLGSNADDQLNVTGDTSRNIWLDGSKGVYYSGIDIVNASTADANMTLAGAGSYNVSLVGGKENNTLWGGLGSSDDTLKGGTDGKNTFFYALGNGNDVLQNVQAGDDILLTTINLSDIASHEVKSDGFSITTTAGQTLTAVRASGETSSTITMADGSKFIANYSEKKWEQG